LDEFGSDIMTVDDLLLQDSPEQAAGFSLLNGVILDRRASILGGSCPGKSHFFRGDTTGFNGSRNSRSIQNGDVDGFFADTEGIAGSDDVLPRVLPAGILDGQSGGSCSGLNVHKIRGFEILSSL